MASTKMSQAGIEVFKKAVNYILTEWPSLNFAIDNGMGGNQAKEIREWMCKTVGDTMLKGVDIDVEDFLAEIINQEFDTIIEDGSLEYNAKWIEKFYKDCLAEKEQEVVDQIKKASAKKLSLGHVKIPTPVCQNEETSDDESEDTDNDNELMQE